jgi:hypothetical protein
MPNLAFAAPILPGKTDEDREDMRSSGSGGERHAPFQASRARQGITREAVWIQQAPGGDLAVVYIEADDLPPAFAGLCVSQDPLDPWFREQIRDVHGIDLEDGFRRPNRPGLQVRRRDRSVPM